MYLTLVCEPHLINIEEGTKLLKVKRSTRTLVSSDTMTTVQSKLRSSSIDCVQEGLGISLLLSQFKLTDRLHYSR